MAMKPYPSNLIIFNIDERVLDEEMRLEIKRSWTHIGDILIRSRAAEEGEDPASTVHVIVKYGTRTYLSVDDPESCSNWEDRIERHLLATMRKVSSNVIAFNRRRRNCGMTEVAFDRIEFELEGGKLTMEFRLDSNGSVPVDCAAIATKIRDAFGTGKLGGAVRVRVPSLRSLAEQAERSAIQKAERAALEQAALEERLANEEAAREELEAQAEERFMESPEMAAAVAEEEAAEEKAAKGDSPLEITPLTDEEWEARYGVPEAEFEIDYDMWEAVFPDGSTREYDPQTGSFIE